GTERRNLRWHHLRCHLCGRSAGLRRRPEGCDNSLHAARHGRALSEHTAVCGYPGRHERRGTRHLPLDAFGAIWRLSCDAQVPAIMSVVSARVRSADAAFAVVKRFYFESRYGERRLDPGICDFTFGNPHEMPLDGIVAALRDRAVPHDEN